MAGSRRPGHPHSTNGIPAMTPSSWGIHDAGDPNVSAERGDTEGPVGTGGDHASHIRVSGRKPPLTRSPPRQESSPNSRVASIPYTPPSSPETAPSTIDLPASVQAQLNQLFMDSSRDVNHLTVDREMACTLVIEKKTGALLVVNKHPGTDGSSSPDYTIGDDQELVGTFHTHPDRSGRVLAFDAADAANFVNSSERVRIIQSQKQQYMYLRTGKTPASAAKTMLKDRFDKLSKPQVEGQLDVTHSQATDAVSRALAELLRLALYRGANGALKRIYPPAH